MTENALPDFVLQQVMFLRNAMELRFPGQFMFEGTVALYLHWNIWKGATRKDDEEITIEKLFHGAPINLLPSIPLDTEVKRTPLHTIDLAVSGNGDKLRKWLHKCNYLSDRPHHLHANVFVDMHPEMTGPLHDFGRLTVKVHVMNGEKAQHEAQQLFLSDATASRKVTDLSRILMETMVSSDPNVTWHVPIPTSRPITMREFRSILGIYVPESVTFMLFNDKGHVLQDHENAPHSDLYLMPYETVSLRLQVGDERSQITGVIAPLESLENSLDKTANIDAMLDLYRWNQMMKTEKKFVHP